MKNNRILNQSIYFWGEIGLISVFLLTTIVCWIWGDAIVEGIYHGKFQLLMPITEIMEKYRQAKPGIKTVEWYQGKLWLVHAKFFMICSMAMLGLLALHFRGPLKIIFNNFMTGSSHPINLAMFRIIFFGYLTIWLDIDRVVWFSSLPSVFIDPPVGFETILNWVTIHPDWVVWTCRFYLIFCIFATIGLFSKFSSFMVFLLGLWVIGIPQFYGKVNGHNHLIWFSLIMALAPCGDMLSVDSVIQVLRNKKQKLLLPPNASSAYGLPIRFIFLLLGVIYLFPGVWKFWSLGYDWIFSDNLKFIMYRVWVQNEYLPIFRLDQYPWIFQFGGLMTLLFEIGFIFIIFLPSLRRFLPLAALAFHNVTGLTLAIFFYVLQIVHVGLLNWKFLFEKLGGLLFRQKLYVLYDGNCGLCRKSMAILMRLDVLGQIQYVNALDKTKISQLGFDSLDDMALLKDMHAIIESKQWRGYDSYRKICARILFLWPILPFLYFYPIAVIGRSIYRKVADQRSCQLPIDDSSADGKIEHPQMTGTRLRITCLLIVGWVFVVVNFGYGMGRMAHSWPFHCYPLFTGNASDKSSRIIMEQVYQDQTREVIDQSELRSRLGPSRHITFMAKIIRKKEDQQKQDILLKNYFEILASLGLDMSEAQAVEIYREKFYTSPEHREDPPVERELMLKINVDELLTK